MVEKRCLSPEGRRRLVDQLPQVFDPVLADALRFAGRSYVRVHVGGSSAQDVAVFLINEAVARTMSGKRTWKHETVDLEVHLFQTIRSIVDGYRKKEIRRDRDPPDDKLSKLCATDATPEVALGEAQECALLEEALFDAAGEDEQLLKLVEVIQDGASTPSQVQAETQWPKDLVHVLFKKLRRRVRPLLARQEDLE